jgi:hypothetical protein
MSTTDLTIPPDLVEDLRAGLIEIYAVKADALSGSLNDFLRGRAPMDLAHRHRDEMVTLETLLNQVGWEQQPTTGPVAVEGTVALLSEAIGTRTMDAIDDVLGQLSSPTIGGYDTEKITGQFRHAQRLLEALVLIAKADGAH